MKIAIHAAVSSSGAKIPAARANAVSAILGVFNGRGSRTRGISSHHGTVPIRSTARPAVSSGNCFATAPNCFAELENARVLPKGSQGFADFLMRLHGGSCANLNNARERTTIEVSKTGFLVLTKPGSNQPSIRAREDLHYQSVRAKRGLEKLRALVTPNKQQSVSTLPRITSTIRTSKARMIVSYTRMRKMKRARTDWDCGAMRIPCLPSNSGEGIR